MGGYQSKHQSPDGNVGVGGRIRDMGSHEAYQTAMHTLDQYRGTVVACRYSPQPGLQLKLASVSDSNRDEALTVLKSSFINALARVLLDQPHLHVGISGEQSRYPAFVRLAELNLRDHVEWRSYEDDDQLEQAYIDTMQQQLDSRFYDISVRPGWRLIVLYGPKFDAFHVLYVWNHVHHDGMSGVIFHRQLLRALNEQTSSARDQNKAHIDNDSDANIDIDISMAKWTLHLPNSTHRLPPNGEILCSWPLDPLFLLKWLYNDFKPVSFFAGSPHATWAPIKCTPYATRFRTFTVKTSIVTKLVSECRLHKTTITGLMHALVLVSLTSSLKPAPGTGFASRTPYDLRHFLPSKTPEYPWLIPKETMCNYDSVLDHEYEPGLVATIREKMAFHVAATDGDTDLGNGTSTIAKENPSRSLPDDVIQIIWKVSSRIRAEIAARLASGTKNDLLAVMGYCPDWNSQQRREARRTRYLSWLVTNLGVLDSKGRKSSMSSEDKKNYDDDGGEWSMNRAELVLSAEVPSAVFSISIMTVKDQEMCVTCSWQDGVVDARVGESLVQDLERWMNQIGA